MHGAANMRDNWHRRRQARQPLVLLWAMRALQLTSSQARDMGTLKCIRKQVNCCGLLPNEVVLGATREQAHSQNKTETKGKGKGILFFVRGEKECLDFRDYRDRGWYQHQLTARFLSPPRVVEKMSVKSLMVHQI